MCGTFVFLTYQALNHMSKCYVCYEYHYIKHQSIIEIFNFLSTVITRQLLKGREIMYGVSIRKMINYY